MVNKTIKGMKASELKILFEETVEKINIINDAQNSIEEYKKKALDLKIEISGDEENNGIIGDIKDKQIEVSEKFELIQEVHAELLGDEEDESDKGLKGELDDLLERFQLAQTEIKTAKKELYGHEEKNEKGEDEHIEGLIENVNNFFEIQKKKYTEIFNKIEKELLHGATTVGLSKAYDDKASSYKTSNIFWLIGFFISVLGIIAILYLSLLDIEKHFFTKLAVEGTVEGINAFSSLKNENLLKYFIINGVIKIGIISSLVWVASFMGKRYNQNKRLSEEYSYKATFAKSFEGYRKKAEDFDELSENRILSEKLMNNMIEMSAFNPVDTMESKSHKEGHPTMKLFEKLIDTFEKTVKVIDKIK